jgi:hypothetical protein
MAEIKLDYVNSFINRHGKPCHQFRRKGHPKVTIKGRPGSPEFMARYHELIEKTGGSSTIEIGATHTKAGSVSDLLVRYYKSDVFKKGLARATQKTSSTRVARSAGQTFPLVPLSAATRARREARSVPRRTVSNTMDLLRCLCER